MPGGGTTRNSRFCLVNRYYSITTSKSFPLSHSDLCPHFWLFFSCSIYPFFSTSDFPFALCFSLPNWPQPVPLVFSPQSPCQSSLNILLRALVLPRSGSQSTCLPRLLSSILTELLKVEDASGDCLVRSTACSESTKTG